MANGLPKDAEEIRKYNSHAWDVAVVRGSEWTVPVGPDEIAAARKDEWTIRLTPSRAVPREWFPSDLAGVDVLCLASGGGQQGPLLAATGANVTVLDNSPAQLAKDAGVADREGLSIRTIEGDMADLSAFRAETFDLIVHPTSNLFVPNVLPVWREAFRVLRPGGALIAGFMNPVFYLFDQAKVDVGILEVRHKLPYSDLASVSAEEREQYEKDWQPHEFGHTLDDQIGGQLAAGFVIAGFYEDVWPGTALAEYTPTFVATRAVRSE